MTTNTAIIGIGQTNVSEKWDTSLRHLAWYAMEAALDDAHISTVDAIYVGNMLAGRASNQRHLGSLISDFAGMRGVEAMVVESAEASGAAAVRQAVLAVASGQIRTALVVGVEKCSDMTGADFDEAIATALDAEYEQVHGMTPVAAAALLMRRYQHQYGIDSAEFAQFSVKSHENGSRNPLAMFRNRLRKEGFMAAPFVADPVNLFDMAPMGDGSAAIIIAGSDDSADRVAHPIEILSSTLATDTLALHHRRDPLWLKAVAASTEKALKMAGVTLDEIDLFELHDAYTILATLSLEAVGLAERGQGYKGTDRPMSTFGGLKARGNPLGATGVYQIVEVARQLRGQAGENQIANARIGMAQNLGGMAATAVTHILGSR